MNPKARKFLKFVTKEMLDSKLESLGYDVSLLYSVAYDDGIPSDINMSSADEARDEIKYHKEQLALELYYNS